MFQRLPALDVQRAIAYVGRYYSDEPQADGSQLELRIGARPARPLDRAGRDLIVSGSLRLNVERDDDGNVAAMRLDAGRVRGLQLEKR